MTSRHFDFGLTPEPHHGEQGGDEAPQEGQQQVPEGQRRRQREYRHIKSEELEEVEVSGGEFEVLSSPGGSHVLHQPLGVSERVQRVVLNDAGEAASIGAVTVHKKQYTCMRYSRLLHWCLAFISAVCAHDGCISLVRI